MASIGTDTDDCGKPNCDREAEETYEGPNGNTVRVCGMHYYKLVTRGASETSPLGIGTDRLTQPYSEITLDDSGTGEATTEPIKPNPSSWDAEHRLR